MSGVCSIKFTRDRSVEISQRFTHFGLAARHCEGTIETSAGGR